MHREALIEALPGYNVGFNIKHIGVEELKRGYVASNAYDDPARRATNFTSQVIIMNHPGLDRLEMAMPLFLTVTPPTLLSSLLSLLPRLTDVLVKRLRRSLNS
jgi:translation elongation factor EF-1alpha